MSKSQLATAIAVRMPESHRLEWWNWVHEARPSKDDLRLILESVQSMPVKSVASRSLSRSPVLS